MQRELLICNDPIDEAKLIRAHSHYSSETGAVIRFLGVVRSSEEGAPIQAIEYEAFGAMAAHQFGLLFDAVEQGWPVHSVRLIHRIGRVAAGEASLWVEVIAPHRGEAFAACQFLIDEMKRKVPIWKKPITEGGDADQGSK
jgi:molybdopterin synthase catalytic subunit